MTRSRLDSFPNHYCLCLELYRDIRLQCMIRKSFVHRLSLILILDEISIEMCSVFDRFCTMKFSRFLLSHSKQLIHYSASVGSCQALFKTFLKSFVSAFQRFSHEYFSWELFYYTAAATKKQALFYFYFIPPPYPPLHLDIQRFPLHCSRDVLPFPETADIHTGSFYMPAEPSENCSDRFRT